MSRRVSHDCGLTETLSSLTPLLAPCWLASIERDRSRPSPKVHGYSLTFTKYQFKARMSTHDRRIAQMTFASVYPMYVAKVKRKGRTEKELDQVIKWLTGFDNEKLQGLIEANVTFEIFFRQASLNPNAHLITGVICGYRVEEIKDPLTQQIRYLDKLVDELAKGRTMEKILRKS